jgi:hypothetical protein
MHARRQTVIAGLSIGWRWWVAVYVKTVAHAVEEKSFLGRPFLIWEGEGAGYYGNHGGSFDDGRANEAFLSGNRTN